MGRSGRSGGSSFSGGSRSSGGFSGGGRSGGSRSSGRSSMSSLSRSSMSSSSRSSSSYRGSSNFGRSSNFGTSIGNYAKNSVERHAKIAVDRNIGRAFGNYGYGRYGGYGYGGFGYGGYGARGSIIGDIVGGIVAIIVLLLVCYMLMGAGSANITNSTIERQKLETTVSLDKGFYSDELGWIRSETQASKGLKHFYNKTGVAPYVYIINNVNGNYDPSTETLEQFASDKYNELFNDQGHLLLVFWDHEGSWQYTTWLGSQTGVVMDAEARDILFDYIDYYYYEAPTEDEFFSKAFEKAADRMMEKTKSPFITLGIVAGGAVIIVIAFVWWKESKRKKAEQDERNQEILNTPLEKMSDELADLENKYK